MEKYYRVSLKNKEGNIIYPNIHDFITFNETTGSMTIANSVGRACFKTDRTDTDTSVWMGVGASGTNHGVYSEKLANWIVYSDGTKSYLNGNANTASKWQTARAIGIVNSDGTGTAVTVSVDGSKNINLKLPSEIKANTSSATKLQTARKINGVNFDGTADITVYDSTKLPLAGGTMTGNISYNMHGCTNIPVKVYGGNKDGLGISVGAGGATIVGAGESAKACESLLDGGTEHLWLTSDNNIVFYVACNTIDNRAGVTLDSNRNFYPNANAQGNIGTSGNKWANVYANSFHGYLDGNSWGSNLLVNRGNKNAVTGTANPEVTGGASFHTCYNGKNYPNTYGNVFTLAGSGMSQVFYSWNGNKSVGQIFYRSRRDYTGDGTTWSSWVAFPFTSNNSVRDFRAGTIATWNSGYSGYHNGTIMFCW